MNDQPRKWTYNYDYGYCAITDGVKVINGIAITRKNARDICDAHNATLGEFEGGKMSNQPQNPTPQELYGTETSVASDQPQAWTPEYVDSIITRSLSAYDLESICRAHNAALAARIKTTEYAQGWDDHLAASRKQLAASQKLYHSTLIIAEEQAKQLAAEREKVKALSELLGEFRMKLDWSVIDGTDLERIDKALSAL